MTAPTSHGKSPEAGPALQLATAASAAASGTSAAASGAASSTLDAASGTSAAASRTLDAASSTWVPLPAAPARAAGIPELE
jgi:hypothetical protein